MLATSVQPAVKETDFGRQSDPRAENPEFVAVSDSPSIHRGLCVNCDLRETCAFHKPEGGVWFCEEYQ
jgi:hypothetical protein